jgi:hypothetical protein
MPYNVVISQSPPAMGDLGGAAKRGGVEVSKDLEGEFGGKSCEEVDSDQFADAGRDEGELREAALSQNALKHQLALLGWGRREQRPDMRDSLLVTLWKCVKFGLKLSHGLFIGLSPALGIWLVTVAVACVHRSRDLRGAIM